MPFAVLKNFHPMIGRDFHIPWPPGSPSPAPSAVPYTTMSTMMGLGFMCTKADDVQSHYYGLTMLKVTDIGMMIPHIGPPSNLLAIEIPLSGSKSYFGCSRYQSGGKPVAVACLGFTNLNLNCGTPVPTPTGEVIAITTHMMDMSLGDVVAGVLQMGFDFALSWALGKIGGAIQGKITSALQGRLFSRFIFGELCTAVSKGGDFALAEAYAGVMAAARAEWGANVGSTVAMNVINFFVGGPMGYDAGSAGLYGKDASGENVAGPGGQVGNAASSFGDSVGAAVDNHLGNSPPGGPVDIGQGENFQPPFTP